MPKSLIMSLKHCSLSIVSTLGLSGYMLPRSKQVKYAIVFVDKALYTGRLRSCWLKTAGAVTRPPLLGCREENNFWSLKMQCAELAVATS